MIVVSGYIDFDLILSEACGLAGIDFVDYYLHKNDSIKLKKLSNWQDLNQIQSSSDLFFDEVENLANCFVIDFQDLKIDKNLISFLEGFKDQKIILYSTSLDKFKAPELAVFKKLGIKPVKLDKYDNAIKVNLAQKYTQKKPLNLSDKDLKIITSNSKSYFDLKQNLDIISLIDTDLVADFIGVLESFNQKELPVFQRPFRLNNLSSDIKYWKNIDQNDMQLALAILFNKLSKDKTAPGKKALASLINTDLKIKSDSKISAESHFKNFLYQARKLS